MPISPVGDKEAWKKAQKNLKKNITSLTIKSNIPVFMPLKTGTLCHPWYVASRDTSRHHKKATTNIKDTSTNKGVAFFDLISDSIATGSDIIVNPLTNGQGENSTKWKGCTLLYMTGT